MTYAPATLLALQRYWTATGGLGYGIVGDALHTHGYHLGSDRIHSPTGRGDDDYSVQTPRDCDALSEAASAIDLGHPELARLRMISRWLVNQARLAAPGTEDIREVIYSPDGHAVLCWDRERGARSAPQPEGDESHRWHTHISFYRDSVEREKLAIFRRYFAATGEIGAGPRWLNGLPAPAPLGELLAGSEP